jgi:hypothetical protein
MELHTEIENLQKRLNSAEQVINAVYYEGIISDLGYFNDYHFTDKVAEYLGKTYEDMKNDAKLERAGF